MIEINLSMTEKQKLESGHKKARDRREAARIKSVWLKDESWSTEMISPAWRMHETCLRRHLQEYLAKNKLTTNNGGSQSKLNDEPTQDLFSIFQRMSRLITIKLSVIFTNAGPLNLPLQVFISGCIAMGLLIKNQRECLIRPIKKNKNLCRKI